MITNENDVDPIEDLLDIIAQRGWLWMLRYEGKNELGKDRFTLNIMLPQWATNNLAQSRTLPTFEGSSIRDVIWQAIWTISK